MLRELVRDLGADGVGGLAARRRPGARELARLLPELGEPGLHADPGEARARMFEQALALFEHLAESTPLVLVIEDAHWSDRSTRDLLAFLVGNQRVLQDVMIVVTFRSDELDRAHPLRPVLAELDRLDWVARLDLPRLTRREGRELTAGLLGPGPDSELADRVSAAARATRCSWRRCCAATTYTARAAGVTARPGARRRAAAACRDPGCSRRSAWPDRGAGTRCWPRSPGSATRS